MLVAVWYMQALFPLSGWCSASEQYVEQLKDTLAHSTPKKGVAAFIAEPIQVKTL